MHKTWVCYQKFATKKVYKVDALLSTHNSILLLQNHVFNIVFYWFYLRWGVYFLCQHTIIWPIRGTLVYFFKYWFWFKQLQVQYGLKYNQFEKNLRKANFEKSRKFIDNFNLINDDVQLKVNQFSDWVRSFVQFLTL